MRSSSRISRSLVDSMTAPSTCLWRCSGTATLITSPPACGSLTHRRTALAPQRRPAPPDTPRRFRPPDRSGACGGSAPARRTSRRPQSTTRDSSPLGGRQFGHQHRVAGPAQHAAVGDQPALRVEQAGRASGSARPDGASSGAPSSGSRISPSSAESSTAPSLSAAAKISALRLQQLDLLSDQARLELAEIKKAEREQRQAAGR